MAAGCNYLNYERLHDICCGSSSLHDFVCREKLLLDFHSPCSCCSDGFVNIHQDKSAVDCYVWRCSIKKCNYKCSVHRDSFFAGSHLSIVEITKIIYYWTLGIDRIREYLTILSGLPAIHSRNAQCIWNLARLEGMRSSPLVAHHFQVDQCARQ